MKPFLDVLGLISASLLVRSHYRKMPILACLKSKNRSKSPFSIGLVFSIVSESTVDSRGSGIGPCTPPPPAFGPADPDGDADGDGAGGGAERRLPGQNV